jgi:hypothetical protein
LVVLGISYTKPQAPNQSIVFLEENLTHDTSAPTAVVLKNLPKGHDKSVFVVNIETMYIDHGRFLCEPNGGYYRCLLVDGVLIASNLGLIYNVFTELQIHSYAMMLHWQIPQNYLKLWWHLQIQD